MDDSAHTIRTQINSQQQRVDRLARQLDLPHRRVNAKKEIKAAEHRIAQLQRLLATLEDSQP